MRLSLLQLARLGHWEESTIDLIAQALSHTPECSLDFLDENEIDLRWYGEYRSLRGALDRLLFEKFGVNSRDVEGRAADERLTPLQGRAELHLRRYLESLSGAVKAIRDSSGDEIYKAVAIRETHELLNRMQKRDFSAG